MSYYNDGTEGTSESEMSRLNDQFLRCLDLRENELKDPSNTSEERIAFEVTEEQQKALRIEEIQRIRSLYLSSRFENLGISAEKAFKELTIDRISDFLIFSRLAYFSRIHSPILQNYYKDNYSGDQKTYGEERETIKAKLRKVMDEFSDVSEELRKVDRSILNEEISPKILEQDEDSEEDQMEDPEKRRKMKIGGGIISLHNYDGDSEKSCYTENESGIPSSKINRAYKFPSYRRPKYRYAMPLFGYKSFKKSRQNKFREEKFAYDRQVLPLKENITNISQNIKEFESDRPENEFSLHFLTKFPSQTDQEDPSSAAHLSPSNKMKNSQMNDSSYSNSNIAPPPKNFSTQSKKPFNFAQRRQNPCRNFDDYETDREKEYYVQRNKAPIIKINKD